MVQLIMTVTIGDGRVVATEFNKDMEAYATARDLLELNRLKMVVKARVQRFARREQSGENQ